MTKLTPHNHRLGWTRDLPDHRDYLYSTPADILKTLPHKADLRSTMPPVYDQGDIGSCTSNAIGAAFEFDRIKLNETPAFTPSRLFIYYNERSMERTIPLDAGAEIRDGIKSVATLGVCPESEWPYLAVAADPTTNLFPVGSPPVTKPSAKCYTDAKEYTAIAYYRVQQTITQLKGCLAQGFPFVFGFTVFSNLYDATGNPVITLNLPAWRDSMLGGHAVMAVGYDDTTSMFVIRNSWGPAVQDKGYFYMAYQYVTDHNLSSDFWTIRRVSS